MSARKVCRLFCAIYPPQPAREELSHWISDIDAPPEWRWTDPDTWHITIAFFAAWPEAELPRLRRRMIRAARLASRPRLALESSGVFQGRQAGKTLWVGVSGDISMLGHMAQTLDFDSRPLRPHVTVARARVPAADPEPLTKALSDFSGTPWVAGELVLVRSQLGPVVTHTPLVSIPLSINA